MNRAIRVAIREFQSTVLTRGFILGVLITPVIIVVALTLVPLLMNKAGPQASGHIAVIDRTGLVGARLEKAYSPEEVAKRQAEKEKKVAEVAQSMPMAGPGGEAQAKMVAKMLEGPKLSVKLLAGDLDPELAKEELLAAEGKERDATAGDQRLALAVIPNEAVKMPGVEAFGPYQLFVAPKLDFEVQRDIEDQIDRAIVDARIESSGLDTAAIRRLTKVPVTEAKAVTRGGEKETSRAAGIFIPMAFMMLLWVSVFTAGQYLLTSLIEEKSSRVMEVLLSAVSPMELMVGKIVGQMGVGLLILGVYGLMGVASIMSFNLTHLLDPMSMVYLMIYFMIAFFLVAAMMAAIGSAVADVREAQTLMTPVMLVLMIPMMLWLPIQRNPNSMFSQIVSFIPPINPFVMVLRLTGSEKVPGWQIPASMAAGIIGAVAACWAAAKIFRVGVLMYGKPPSLVGLLKWIRYA